MLIFYEHTTNHFFTNPYANSVGMGTGRYSLDVRYSLTLHVHCYNCRPTKSILSTHFTKAKKLNGGHCGSLLDE